MGNSKISFIVCSTLIILLSSHNSFSQPEINQNGYNKFYYGNGQISSEGNMVNGKPDGYWITYYINGKIKSEGNRRNFLLDSLWVFFDEDGDTVKKINYLNGQKNGYYYTYEYLLVDEKKTGGLISMELYVADTKQGVSYYYYPNGKLEKTITFDKNIRSGISRVFDEEDGRLISIIEYLNDYPINKQYINRIDKRGNKQGTWKYFNEKWILLKEENYQNGKLHGYVREYNSKGKVIKSVRYENGIEVPDIIEKDSLKVDIISEFDTTGYMKKSGAYRNGVPVGIHKEFNEKGEIIKSVEYDDLGNIVGNGIVDGRNHKQGYWKEFYSSGELKSEGEYINNRRNGKWKFYFKSGKLEQEGTYNKGKANGLWKWFYENGQIEREENFLNGKEEGQMIEYNSDGKIITKGEYLDGYEEGEWFYHVGDHTETGIYRAGIMEGIWKHYYENGKIRYEGNYILGNPDGRHRQYYDNGKLKEDGYYSVGKKDGNWKKYDNAGNLIMLITYENGVEKKIDGIKILKEKEKN